MDISIYLRLHFVCFVIATSAANTLGQEGEGIVQYDDAKAQLDLLRRGDVILELAATSRQQDRIRIGLRQARELLDSQPQGVNLQREEKLYCCLRF